MKRYIFNALLFLAGNAFVFSDAFAQTEYRYKNQFSTGEEASRLFGIPPTHSKNDPSLSAGSFKFELGTTLECGNIDIKANIQGQFEELQKQLKELVPQNAADAQKLLTASAFTTMCYAYPTICAQLRHDWLSIQGKLNLRAQACAAVDKFIDSQADKGARQLKSEALAACVNKNSSRHKGDVAATMAYCQDPDRNKSGLVMRDFQTGLMRKVSGEKQRVLKSILSFSKDDASYDFLASFLGEIQVGTNGNWEPLFDKGLLRPTDVADTFLTKGQSLLCNRLEDILKGRFVATGIYETEVVSIVKRKLSKQTSNDIADLSLADKQIACLALGRAIGREAALHASSRFESAVSVGLLNTAIPEPLRAEYRDRALSAFPAMRQALDGETIPSVDRVRFDLSEFAKLQRAKTTLLASETNRARLKNSIGDSRSKTECADSVSCE